MLQLAIDARLWNELSNGVAALQQLGSLIKVISTSWDILSQVLSRDEKKIVRAQRLREELLAIYKGLRQTYFSIRQQGLLPEDDFLTLELCHALETVEEACAVEPSLLRLELVLDKAQYIQDQISQRLLIPTAPPAASGPSETQSLLLDISAKTCMVAQALRMEPESGHEIAIAREPSPPVQDDTGKIAALRRALGAPAFLQRQCFSGADVEDDAAYYDVEVADDDGYYSCDEEVFWSEARADFIRGNRITPVASARHFGVPLFKTCTAPLLDQALRMLGEDPTWGKVHEDLWQHGSSRYAAVVNRRSSGIVSVLGDGAGHFARDLNRAIEVLETSLGSTSRHRGSTLRNVVADGGRVRCVKYSGPNGFVFDASGLLDLLDEQ